MIAFLTLNTHPPPRPQPFIKILNFFYKEGSDVTSLPSLLVGRSSNILPRMVPDVFLQGGCVWRQTREVSLQTPGGELTGVFLASCSSLLLSARARDQWPHILPP